MQFRAFEVQFAPFLLKNKSKDVIKKAMGSDEVIADIAGRIASFFVAKKVIDEEEKEIYVYGFEMTISFLLNLMIVLLLAILTRTFFCSMLFLLGFMPLRIVGGGYHAKNHFSCMLTLVMIYVLFLGLTYWYPMEWKNITAIVIMILATTLIFMLAPLEDENHPLEERQKRRLKIKSRVFILLSVLFVVLGMVAMKKIEFIFSFSLGYLTVALSMFISAIKSEFKRNWAIWKGGERNEIKKSDL